MTKSQHVCLRIFPVIFLLWMFLSSISFFLFHTIEQQSPTNVFYVKLRLIEFIFRLLSTKICFLFINFHSFSALIILQHNSQNACFISPDTEETTKHKQQQVPWKAQRRKVLMFIYYFVFCILVDVEKPHYGQKEREGERVSEKDRRK